MISIIRLLLTIAIVVLIVRWISKLFTPRYSGNPHGSDIQNQQEEGKTTIHVKKKVKNNIEQKKGDYVDFEEVN